MASSSSQGLVINPGSEDPSLLRFQSIHVSEHIWDGREHPIIKSGATYQLPLDRHLITTLVERWRLKTHTFHMPPGECTIMLQDIAIQIGLRVNGLPVFAATGSNWPQIVEDSLGIRPPPKAFVGSNLKLRWLEQHFTDVVMHNQNELQLTRFTRAYTMRLIGGFMLADHSSSRVTVRYLPLLEDFTIAGKYS
ncbi:serine/threonine-protein phosphatase 7 long form homolog [Abrus precatorius]|uniref:Serine/threonine-protein phosphatase 7 long form homolog n=1 Tax=Abrus precatorius TaxID=3816 RepID=A0A8B8L076_ABRPR|nr:serine/threonine-protein phosphatase 7 long form homolog [Abrus precatorius]